MKVLAWAWQIENVRTGRWLLCQWAEATRQALVNQGKPSPEARAVRVTLVLVQRMKAKKRGKG